MNMCVCEVILVPVNKAKDAIKHNNDSIFSAVKVQKCKLKEPGFICISVSLEHLKLDNRRKNAKPNPGFIS